jgi:radical SAM superfamily enzyme YgiQ (UPF0313 family)
MPLQMARQAGLMTLGHFILGMPGETAASMRRTIGDAMTMDLDFVQFYAAAPLVGSPLFEEARKKGYLDNIAFSSIGQSSASLRLPGLLPAKVDHARRNAILRFYLRPRQIWRLVRFAGFGLFLQFARLLQRRWGIY